MSTLTAKVAEAANYVVITGDTPALTPDNETIVWECLNALGIFDDDISYLRSFNKIVRIFRNCFKIDVLKYIMEH